MSSAAPGTVERAFELARSGACASLDDIRVRLKRENYTSITEHLTGPSIRRELMKLCRDARAPR